MTGTDAPAGTDRTLGALAAERDFLLRSLADLEAEHAAGELTEDHFRHLHDQYTVQAATVLRAIERVGTPTGAPVVRRPRRRRRVLAGAALVLALAGAGGTLLARSLADRQDGETITGNAQSTPDNLAVLARAARQRPDDFDAQMTYAAALMEDGQAVEALRTFDAASRLDPTSAAPKAYGGWIVFLAGLTDDALPRLDAAIATDPSYPDAHFFRGMVLLRGRGDTAGALVELRRFLDLAAPGPERDQVQAVVDQLESDPSTTTTSPG